ncbi:MAG: sugar phosphate isomerase/epimerase [Armatimonadetes bacterium]|nr:sugar phosphate isomerase/epimerase [Armatimonadota bacterium]
MKLAVSMYCYVRAVKAGQLDIHGFVHEAKRIGADGVELLDFFYSDPNAEREGIKEVLAATGLPCPIFSVANNFAKTDPAEREAQLQRIRFGVDEAVFFGAGVVRVFAGDVSDTVGFDQARAWIVDGLSLASDYARNRGVKLALENHGKLAGRSDQVRGLIQDVRQRCGHDTLGANPDTGNFVLVDQDSAEAVSDLADVANMVHFKDFKPGDGPYQALSGKTFRGTVIGEGTVDLGACIQGLQTGGFDGWLSLEYEGEGDPVAEVQSSLENARKYL